MADTYIPSGEESAQEQQFLQALVGQIQSKENSAVPKYATELYCNFAGRYDTLAVNASMMASTAGFFFPGLANYKGFFICPGQFGNAFVNPPATTYAGLSASGNGLLGGANAIGPFFTSSPTYVPGFSDWGAGIIPNSVISQTPGQNIYPNLAFYRQSFLPSPFYIFMPKWMKSFTVGMRLYDNLGALQPILIASKNNAKWQDATINSLTAPDGSYQITSLTPQQFQQEPNAMFYIAKTSYGYLGSAIQFELTRKWFIVNSFNESPSGGNSSITASLSNYQNNLASPYDFNQWQYAIEYWNDTILYDARPGVSVILPLKYPTPNPPDVSRYPLANQTFSFQFPAPPSLPYRYYFRFLQCPGPPFNPLNNGAFTSTFAVNYPAGYPSDPATFTVEPASFDIAKVTIANYAAVNPQPAGFPALPVGIPTFNSLTLATIPLIGADITAPL